MKNLENVKMLNEVEMNTVAGGMIWPGIPPLDPFDPLNEKNRSFSRSLPFPQDRRRCDLTDLPCDDPFYTKAADPSTTRQPVFPDYPDGPWVI